MTQEEKNEIFDRINAGEYRTKRGLLYSISGRLVKFPTIYDECGNRAEFCWETLGRFANGEGCPDM